MNIILPRPFASFFLTLFISAFALAQSDPDIIRRVDDHYNHLRSLRARYTERYTGMGMNRGESGTLLLKKPGLMRWSYDTPAGRVFVLDGKYAWFYTPGDAQVSRSPAKQLDDLRSPLRLLLGHTELEKELDGIKLGYSCDGCLFDPQVPFHPSGFVISGVPKGMGDRVRLLTLTVTPTGAIKEMMLEETDGANTVFTFTDMEENVSLKASDFTFTPPPGVPVIDALPPI